MRRLHEMSYVELEKHAIDVISELKIKAYGKGYEQGKMDAEMEAGNALETAQEQRDRIVEQAKEDVRKLVDDAYGGEGHDTGELPAVAYIGHVTTEFSVNKEKRTVVALLRYKYITDGVVRLKGIAKCAPDDCFNVHIGKAIALRRALGLDVPSEYMDAPQPTEVRVGDVVKAPAFEHIRAYTVDNIRNLRVYDYDGTYLPCEDVITIDDSRQGGAIN